MSKMTKAIAALGVVAGLGVAALPLSSYAATDPATANVVVSATVPEGLSISTDEAKLDLGTVMPDGDAKTGKITATVTSNAAGGYNINIKSSGDGNMIHMENGVAAADGAKIAGGDLTGSASSWGYSLDGTTFKAVPAAGENILTTKGDLTAEALSATQDIYFGVRVVNGQATGTYQNTVTLTAVAEN